MAPGWFFKKGKPKKVFPAKYNNRPKVRGSTLTPVARVLSEQKQGDKGSSEGASVLYRDHIRSVGSVSHKYTEAHPNFRDAHVVPVTIFGEYVNVPRSKRPPIVNVIYDRIVTQLQTVNPKRTAFSLGVTGGSCKDWNHIVPIDERYRKLFYFFSGSLGFFVERDYIQNRIRMSRDYETSTARRIYVREQWERIVWVAVEVTPDCDPLD